MAYAYNIIAIAATILCAACIRVPCETGAGGGGAAGATSSGASCYPLHDNDPVACAENHCTMVHDGCGREIRCDTVCNTMNTPASCTLDHKGHPFCAPCDLAPTDDAFCANDPEKSSAYHCMGQYPQPLACAPKTLNLGQYVACCGNPH